MELQAAIGLEARKAAALRRKSKGGLDRLREKHQAKVDDLSWRNGVPCSRLLFSGHLMQRADSLEETLMRGKIAGRRRRGPQRKRWLDGITDSVDMSLASSGRL